MFHKNVPPDAFYYLKVIWSDLVKVEQSYARKCDDFLLFLLSSYIRNLQGVPVFFPPLNSAFASIGLKFCTHMESLAGSKNMVSKKNLAPLPRGLAQKNTEKSTF